MAKFQKGQSGNPGGRPKAADGLRRRLEKAFGRDAATLVNKLAELTNDKDPRVRFDATKLALAYLAGTPVQRSEMTDGDGKPLTMKVVFGGRFKPDGGNDEGGSE